MPPPAAAPLLLATCLALCVWPAVAEQPGLRGVGFEQADRLHMGFEQADLLKAADARTSFDAAFHAPNDSDMGRSIADWEDAIFPAFRALPKDADGMLSGGGARYLLHRSFMHRRGWSIRGLARAADELPQLRKSNAFGPGWIPGALLNALRLQVGHSGINLRHTAVLAAAIDHLALVDATRRLRESYRIHRLPLQGTIEIDVAMDAVVSYFVFFLVKHNKTFASHQESVSFDHAQSRLYPGWDKVVRAFLEKNQRDAELGHEGTGAKGRVAFEQTAALAEHIGEQYWRLNENDCASLSSQLVSLESEKPGRVRLAHFYAKGMHGYWRFMESAEYLKAIGALDDSDPESLHVILQNYVGAGANCMDTSGVYTICCKSPCEGLMASLEGAIASPLATPEQVAALVGELPSATVAAPRQLAPALLERLYEAAASNGGQVPLHGRLFAQWMHHAYPRECPYPHDDGVTQNPQTPNEWLAATGGGATASLEHRKRVIDADACPLPDQQATGKQPSCGGAPGSQQLPWSSSEVLISVRATTPWNPAWIQPLLLAVPLLAAAVLSAGRVGFEAPETSTGARFPAASHEMAKKVSIIAAGMFFVYVFLDVTSFAAAMAIGLAMAVAARFPEHRARANAAAAKAQHLGSGGSQQGGGPCAAWAEV